MPHGERSIAPVQVAGRSQSSVPVETVTTLRMLLAGSWAGPDSCPIVMPAKPGLLGMDDRELLVGGGLDHLGDAGDVGALVGREPEPEPAGVGDDVEHPAIGDVDGDRPELRHLDRCVEMGREGGHVPERHAR